MPSPFRPSTARVRIVSFARASFLKVVLVFVCIAGCERQTNVAAETLPERRASDTHVTESRPALAVEARGPTARERSDVEARGPTARERSAVEARGPTARERSDVNAAAQSPLGPRVVFLGDSIAAGLHLPAEQAFPAVLARRLAADGAPFQLANAGVSGDTSAGGLRRVDWVLKQAPAIVVIELGGNDGLRGQPPAAIEQNLREIIARVRARGAQPLLLGMRLPPSYGAEYANAFAAIYPRLAQELEVDFVPFFMEGVAGVSELNLPDGLHPTPAGHERLADKLAAPLKRLILAHSGEHSN